MQFDKAGAKKTGISNVGGGIFGQGERYYLMPGQETALNQDVSSPETEQETGGNRGPSIIDRFFNIFR